MLILTGENIFGKRVRSDEPIMVVYPWSPDMLDLYMGVDLDGAIFVYSSRPTWSPNSDKDGEWLGSSLGTIGRIESFGMPSWMSFIRRGYLYRLMMTQNGTILLDEYGVHYAEMRRGVPGEPLVDRMHSPLDMIETVTSLHYGESA